ncbi:bifunctional diguanylate cyclase/phosphodiesterase [Desulfovibrio inopinatus]|uniref:bifunctional diguanylate cyclase/phosphodiesterase n=1 Tax=Desulfovibrio inopinatus TaxID=102109 RepID=UPI00040EFD85|nr:EAL domain-containing protein [Desulfovibrio inopinatus]
MHRLKTLFIDNGLFVLSAFVIILFPVITYQVIFPMFEGVVFQSSRERAELFSRHLLEIFGNTDTALDEHFFEKEDFSSYVFSHMTDFKVEKVRIFSKDGMIRYSTEPDEVGQTNEESYFYDVIKNGKAYSQLVKKYKQMGDGSLRSVEMYETYVPLGEDTKFLGAAEVYFNVTPQMDALRHVLKKSGVIYGILAVFVLAITAFLNALNAQSKRRTAESERKYRALMEQASDAIVVFDSTGKVIETNSMACRMFSLAEDACLGKHFEEMFPHPDIKLGVTMQDIVELDRMWEFYFRDRAEAMIAEATFKRIDDGRILATVRDVTKRKADEYALQSKTILLETIIDTIPHPIYYKGNDGRYQTVNAPFAKMLGKSREKILGKTAKEILSREFSEIYMQKDAELLQAGGRQTYEAKTPWADGVLHDILFSKSILYDANSIQSGIVGVMLDITERKQAESRLQDANEKLEKRVRQRTSEIESALEKLRHETEERKLAQQDLTLMARVFEDSIEGVTITDSRGTILSVNPAFTMITGYDSEEALGKNPRILKSDRHDDSFYKTMWQTLITKGAWSGEIWNRRKTGEVYPEWLSISTIREESGRVRNYVAVFHDMTDIKRSEETIHFQAYHDALTGLPNRLLLLDRLKVALQHAGRRNKKVAVMFLDLDNFKTINESLGHPMGDQLLTLVASRLREAVHPEDTVARFGGDEFVILLEDVSSAEDAVHQAEDIVERFKIPYYVVDNEIHISASIGITLFPDDGNTPEVLVKNADMAMYMAKDRGRNDFHLFTEAANRRVLRRLAIEQDLRAALDKGEFAAYYQPQVDAAAQCVYGLEALIRWVRSDGIPVSPAEFIPIAEEIGIIREIGVWMLDQACSLIRRLRENGYPDLRVSVNLSARQLRDDALPGFIQDALDRSGIPAHALELEITETSVMNDVDAAIALLHRIASLGVSMSIDDFGTGYSSLYYLKQFPIQELKIDRSFVMDLSDNPDDAAIVKAVISLAHSLGLKVVAEGVETKLQLKMLANMGCQRIQGYFFSKPLPELELLAFLHNADYAVAKACSMDM